MSGMLVVFAFYRNFIFVSIPVSLFGSYLVWSSGAAYAVIWVFWMKVFTNLSLGAYVHFFRPEQLYFFYNLGFPRWKLYSWTLATDFFIWLVLTYITVLFL
jgi:hypothetical protein